MLRSKGEIPALFQVYSMFSRKFSTCNLKLQNIHVCFLNRSSKLKILLPVTLRPKSRYLYRLSETNKKKKTNKKKIARWFNLQFTDSMAGSGPGQHDVVQASGPEEEDPASLGVVLLEQATSQD